MVHRVQLPEFRTAGSNPARSFCPGSYCGGTPEQSGSDGSNPSRGFCQSNSGRRMEVKMRTLFLCLCFLGCKSQPATYEIIEVKDGSEVRDMHGSIRRGQGGQMPEVYRAYGSWSRSDCDPQYARQANPKPTTAVFGSNRIPAKH
jgi:hypothetical protein